MPLLTNQPVERIGGQGLLTFTSNAEIEREKLAQEAQNAPPPVDLDEIASYIKSAADAAVNHRQTMNITARLEQCRRQRAGEYEPEILALIEQQGGTKLYFNETDTKCDAAEAWINDVVLPTGDRSWGLRPTPIPDLSEADRIAVREQVVQEFVGQIGMGVDPQAVMARAQELAEKTLNEIRAKAQKRVDGMSRKIADQFSEGGWDQAQAEFRRFFCTYPTAILKGPIIRAKKRLKWTGEVPSSQIEPIPTWQAVNPFDFYPGPNNTGVNDGYICERVTFNLADLAAQRDQPGWNTAAIDQVLEDSAGSASPSGLQAAINPLSDLPGESDRAIGENRELTTNGGLAYGTTAGWEFWGPVTGKMLAEWGMTEMASDPLAYHEVCAILVGNYVVYAILNPDPLDERPYSVSSFEKVPGSIWGKSIPEKMRDCQDAMNAAGRSLMNNMGLASGPVIMADIDQIKNATDLTQYAPWMILQYHGNASVSPSRKAFELFQPSSHSDEIMNVWSFFSDKADIRTKIPKYTYGDQDVGGAGTTARGLGMLMSTAAKGIKQAIMNIDMDVTSPSVRRQYNWNMRYLNGPGDAEIKGDAQVEPRGVLAALLKEDVQVRRLEFANMTNNPTDMQIIGVDGRRTLLEDIAQSLDLGADVIPTKEALAARMQQEAMNAMAQAAAQPQPGEEGGDVPEQE